MRKYLIIAMFMCFPLLGRTRHTKRHHPKRPPVKKLRLPRHRKKPPPKKLVVDKPFTQKKDTQDNDTKVLAKQPVKVLAKQQVIDLVNTTIDVIMQQPSIQSACTNLKENPQFIKPGIQFILMDRQGMIWFLTQRPHRLWTSFAAQKVFSQDPLLPAILNASTPGIWAPFFWWEDDLTQGYFKEFSFQNDHFILGVIHFVESNEYQRTELAFRIHRFHQEYGMKKTVNTLNSPSGPFVYGRSGLSLYNGNGLCVADSYDQTRVGLNISSLKDEDGHLIFKKIVNAPRTESNFGWTHIKKNGLKRRMIVHQLLRQEEEKIYYQVSGYYPAIDKQFVISLVKDVHALFTHQDLNALTILNTPDNPYIKGNLAIVVYSPDGIIRAHTLYPSLVGVNALKHRGQQGDVVAKNIIDNTMQHNRSWTYHYILNAAENVYAEKVVTPEGTFIVSAHGFIPQTKKHASKVRTDLVCQLLNVNALEYVLDQLSLGETAVTAAFSPVSYGGLFIELYDEQGFCIAAEKQPHNLWKKINPAILLRIKNMKKQNKTKEWTHFAEGPLTKHVTVALCPKNGKDYIIISGYQTGLTETTGPSSQDKENS